MKKIHIFIVFWSIVTVSTVYAQQQFEFCNNFIPFLSFITGQNEGIEQNLDDNFGWMQAQGYTHLRFFGIYANGYHTFPSPTLDANGYPTDSTFETTLEILMNKANQYSIVINFDGLEVIAESNRDTTQTGWGYLTEDEVAAVVQEILSFGVPMITEEQLGFSYLQAIQAVISQMGAIHETTAGYWWPDTTIADEQLGSVFSYYHYDQAELDSLLGLSFPPSNLGNLHITGESAHYHNIPFSIAVGSFGTLETENWKNVLLFAQMQHLPERFSIEDNNTSFLIWDSTFNFMNYVGNEILSFTGQTIGERPIVNLVLDTSRVMSGPFIPAYNASLVVNPAIVNTFTVLGYKVIVTTDSIIPDAEMYYLLLAGGANPSQIAPLPDFVLPLLSGPKPVFVHPTFGIPDENDALDWIPVRNYFGLPSGNTETVSNAIPDSVIFDGFTIKWGGVSLYITPRIELLLSTEIDTSVADVMLSGDVSQEEIALIIQNGNKFLINSNVIHLESSYILSTLIAGPLNAPAIADIAIANGKALIFAEYDTDIDVDIPWTGITRVIHYDKQGNRILDTYIDLGGNYTETLLRGEMVFMLDTLFSISEHGPANNLLSGCFSLSQNYPNPFNSKTFIEYSLSEPAAVTLSIYDASGALIRTLIDEHRDTGHYTVHWDGLDSKRKSIACGIYFCQFQVTTHDKTAYNKVIKMVLLK